jgi:hypothetical protein
MALRFYPVISVTLDARSSLLVAATEYTIATDNRGLYRFFSFYFTLYFWCSSLLSGESVNQVNLRFRQLKVFYLRADGKK